MHGPPAAMQQAGFGGAVGKFEGIMAVQDGSTQALLKRTVLFVAILNAAYFLVEFGVARAIGSVALFADSIDFLEDASVNLLVLFAVGLSASWRRIAGLGFVALLMVPSIAAVWTTWQKIMDPAVADPLVLSITALGALIVNSACAVMLARVRHHGGSLSKAAFLSARNDTVANVAIIVAAGLTALAPSIWPDVIVGLGIAALNAGAAYEVYEAAMGETDQDETDDDAK
jgi:Co/Zn/Cd efflux system component